MAKVLTGNQTIIHKKPIFWEHEGNCAVLDNDFKLVKKFKKGKPDNWELYNIKTDRAEENNIAAANPEMVKKLADEYKKWTNESFVVDWSEIITRNKN